MRTLPSPTEMYRALIEKDATYDGIFYACVKTTGIFCRPVCTARKPKPENVEYVASVQDAMREGYRACKVCRPMETAGTTPAWVAPLLARVEAAPDQRIVDADIQAMKIDPARVRRYFHRTYGMTFHAYQRAWRLGEAMKDLRNGTTVTRATHDAGFASESGFREAFGRLFGDAPGRAAMRGCLRARWLATPLGPMVAIASERGLVLLEFVDRRALEREIGQVRRRFGGAILPGTNDHLAQIAEELPAWLDRSASSFDVALDIAGTDFQRSVWMALGNIPYGETRSYEEIARAIGSPAACRAVGRANGENRLAIVVPCHRVVRSDGTMGGYGGGLWRKRWLLELEQSRMAVAPPRHESATLRVDAPHPRPRSRHDELARNPLR